MFIDWIETSGKRFLLIKSEKASKVYEWLSGAWEPSGGVDAENVIISEGTRVRGIILSDEPSR